MTSMGGRVLITALVALSTGCGDDDEPRGLPDSFSLEAEAAAEVGEFTVDCLLRFVVDMTEVSRNATRVEYLGTMGGEASRSLLRVDGSGIQIFGNAFSDVRVVLTFPDQVLIQKINLPPTSPDDPGSRFWDDTTRFDGVLGDFDMITGEWVCAPLDIEYGGIVDDSIHVPGVWFTTPLDG